MCKVSVILPTYNRLEQLRQVIAALEVQTFPAADFEVVVVSDGSTDGTDHYLHAVTTSFHFVPVTQANQGPAAARNHALLHSKGELVLFIDDDVVPTPRLIDEHVRTHEAHDKALVVLGPMLTPPDFEMVPWVEWEQAMLVKQYRDMSAQRWTPTARQFYTGNASVPHSLLASTNGFDTSFQRAEDVELAYRLAKQGARFVFNPAAIGYHYANRSFTSWLTVAYEYGRNDVIFTRDRGQSWLLPVIMHEHVTRHPFVRQLIRLSLARKMISAIAVKGLIWVAKISDATGFDAITRRAYSGIYNLYHCQGIADELGGRDQFFDYLSAAIGAPLPPHPLVPEEI